ncbi:MAG: hypothetical protein R2806_08675 [Saprospiraceae bacterium]
MKSSILFLGFAGLLLMTSCQKEQPAVTSSVDPELKARLFFESSVTNPVLFAVIKVPESKDEVNGWIISREGARGRFSLPTTQVDLESGVVTQEYLGRMLGSMVIDETIPFAELLSYYQTNKSSAYSIVKTLPDQNEGSTTYFLGYTGYDKPVESQTTCGSGHPLESSSISLDHFYQVTLEASGLHNRVNNDPGAIRTVKWLKSFGQPESIVTGN